MAIVQYFTKKHLNQENTVIRSLDGAKDHIKQIKSEFVIARGMHVTFSPCLFILFYIFINSSAKTLFFNLE